MKMIRLNYEEIIKVKSPEKNPLKMAKQSRAPNFTQALLYVSVILVQTHKICKFSSD